MLSKRSWPVIANKVAPLMLQSHKVSEYLNAGVLVVVVLDPGPQVAQVFSADDPPRTLTTEEELVLPGVLDDFRVRVGQFFD